MTLSPRCTFGPEPGMGQAGVKQPCSSNCFESCATRAAPAYCLPQCEWGDS